MASARCCRDCGVDINDRHANAYRCAPCQTVADRIYRREWHRRKILSDPEYAARKRRSSRLAARRARANPMSAERKRQASRRFLRRKRREDPEWDRVRREQEYAKNRERRRSDPEWRFRYNENQRERYRRLGGKGYRRELPSLLLRQQWLCALCGDPIDEITSAVHVDHILPVSRGGGNEPGNLQAVHATCNFQKGNRV